MVDPGWCRIGPDPAIAAWAASLLTWPWLVGAARRQALALYGAALLLLIFSWWRGASLSPGDWLLPNINMLTMFAAVSTLNVPGQCNEGFLRKDALLVVTFITDEEDTWPCLRSTKPHKPPA